MDVPRGVIRLVGAAPGTGKSEMKKVWNTLKYESADLFVLLEHEDVFSPEMRVKASRTANLQLTSREFVLGFNLPGQLAFQHLLRSVADQNLDVVGFGPFEDVYSEVSGKPLYQKMVEEDFAGYDLTLTYVLIDPSGATTSATVMKDEGMLQVEAEVQRRLRGRSGKSEWQAELDADKIGNPTYYRDRAFKILKSAETFDLDILRIGLKEDPSEYIDELEDLVFGKNSDGPRIVYD